MQFELNQIKSSIVKIILLYNHIVLLLTGIIYLHIV